MAIVPTFTVRSNQHPGGAYEVELVDTGLVTDRNEKIYRFGVSGISAATWSGSTVQRTSELTRAANVTPYTAGQTMLAGGTALQEIANMGRVAGGSGYIVGLRLIANQLSITPRARIHLFNASNPTLPAEAASWLEKYADVAKRVGSYDLQPLASAVDLVNSDCSRVQDYAIRLPFVCAGGQTSLWWCIEWLEALTPASGGKFSLVALVEQN